DSHVVTHHTTNRPACGLSTAERTGSPVLHTLWSYVLDSTLMRFLSRENSSKILETLSSLLDIPVPESLVPGSFSLRQVMNT
ncbi:hypothetical protein P168DRAFT_244375, partial [Aspergillus campestris IBT 28561]